MRPGIFGCLSNPRLERIRSLGPLYRPWASSMITPCGSEKCKSSCESHRSIPGLGAGCMCQPGCSEPLLLTDHGRVVATVVPADEDDATSMLLSNNPKFGAILERSRVRLESEGGLSSTEARRRLGVPAKTGGVI